MTASKEAVGRIDVDRPMWDVNTFVGRYKYFAWMTDPRTCFTSSKKLYEAKALVEQYRQKKEPSGTSREEVLHAMKLYTSAFHPDTGDLQTFLGRMSFQVPGGLLLTGAMLTWYKSIGAVVFWQWMNQSFNAFVNYTNRNANSPTSVTQLGAAYVTATTSALVTALGCKQFWQKRASPLMARYVPFAAVAAANCVNIPMMRQNELVQGIDVKDENNNVVGRSRVAAVKGITQVVISRIVMAAPGMLLLPVVMEQLEKQYPKFKQMTYLHGPFQTVAVGFFLLAMVPCACALFPQQCCLNTSVIKSLEPALYEDMVKRNKHRVPDKVYFNKGL